MLRISKPIAPNLSRFISKKTKNQIKDMDQEKQNILSFKDPVNQSPININLEYLNQKDVQLTHYLQQMSPHIRLDFLKNLIEKVNRERNHDLYLKKIYGNLPAIVRTLEEKDQVDALFFLDGACNFLNAKINLSDSQQQELLIKIDKQKLRIRFDLINNVWINFLTNQDSIANFFQIIGHQRIREVYEKKESIINLFLEISLKNSSTLLTSEQVAAAFIALKSVIGDDIFMKHFATGNDIDLFFKLCHLNTAIELLGREKIAELFSSVNDFSAINFDAKFINAIGSILGAKKINEILSMAPENIMSQKIIRVLTDTPLGEELKKETERELLYHSSKAANNLLLKSKLGIELQSPTSDDVDIKRILRNTKLTMYGKAASLFGLFTEKKLKNGNILENTTQNEEKSNTVRYGIRNIE